MLSFSHTNYGFYTDYANITLINIIFTRELRFLQVTNRTAAPSRYFEATAQAAFLYDRAAETIQEDFRKELDFLSIYDACLSAVRVVVDMPGRRASLLVRLCLQNGGQLSQAKRPLFAELSLPN